MIELVHSRNMRMKSITKVAFFLVLFSITKIGTAQGSSFVFANIKQVKPFGEPAKKLTLLQVFDNLKNHYGVTFLYEDKVIQGVLHNGQIVYDRKIEKTLDNVLKPLGLTYKKVKSGTFVIIDNKKVKSQSIRNIENQSFIYVDSNSPVNQQKLGNISSNSLDIKRYTINGLSDILIKGKVEDGKGVGLPGASITIKGSSKGTTTNVNGNFEIEVPSQNSILVFSYIGYQTKEILVGSQSNITISLNIDDRSLSEVVVIGYGSRDKRDLTGAISTVSSKEISKSVSQSPESAMQGRMAGVFVSSPGGSAFARPQVRIRGVSTFGYAEPLYVVDGIPLTEYGSGTDGSGGLEGDIRGNVNVLAMINPNDIESMSVLKDASAAAIYGVRAANGVILITTKKGSKGSPKIDLSISSSFQNVPEKLNMLNVKQYTDLFVEAYSNNQNEAKNLPDVFKSGSPKYLGNSATYDWQTPLLNKNASNNDYSLRISGGNESTKYYVSGGYTSTEGSLIGNKMDRYSMSINIDNKISKYISTGITYRLSYNDVTDNTASDLRYNAETSPWQPIFDPKGPFGYAPSVNIKFMPNPELGKVIENFIRPQYLSSIPPYVFDGDVIMLYGPETNRNGFGTMATTDTKYSMLRNMGTAFAQIEPISGLKFKGTLSIDWLYNRRNSWEAFDSYLFSQTPGNPYSIGDGTSKGNYGERHTRNLNIIKEFSVNYSKIIGNGHSLDLLFNAMDQGYRYEFLGASSSQILFTQPEFRNINTVTPYSSSGSFRDINGLQGYLGRVGYNFQNKYYLDATIRRDGASRFAPGYKWGTFPAVSVAWRISKENFMKDLTFINDLKLRGGWGRLGNQETRSFAYLSLISNAPDYALGSGDGNGIGTLKNGVSLPDFPVKDLTWEIGETKSVGFDGAFLGNKLTATVEYYNRLTSGILQAAALPASVGNQNPPILNIASVRNKGMEFQLGYNGQISDFQYNISGNLTTVNNKVEKTFRDQPFGGEYGRIEVGQPMNFLWGYKVGGIFQNQSEIDKWKENLKDETNNNNFQPGDMYFQDVSGPENKSEGKITPDDRVFLANTIPGFYYGLNIGANYKEFDLSIFFQGVGDVYRYNNWRANGENMAGAGNNQWVTTLNRWTVANPSTTMPRAVRSDPAGNNRFSDRFVESAAFFRLKNIQFGYAIPSNLTKSLGFINGARIYIGGTNLFVKSKWTGLDPEDADRNGQLVPPVRSLTGGITASF
ncbi:TonB-dependent receptor [Lacihabitans sp. CS3-21]|uniref:SusC/RagA family TonB-linked outer membrane protein n=1 Tax=Lacihabitans sp. CS3-21 TaxID=2487332 RepID=UPI0020CE8BAC|nr:TonB-dependent receptor [Lacihabitans sp. CS3-21]MCP9746412.1 TonB-dependent receptor [Lacihabitans sp. CS3-21]